MLVEHIEGRKEDYIITPDQRMVGRLDHLFKDAVNVIEAQIYQEKTEEVVLRIVRSDKYSSADETVILKEARIRLGNSIRIHFEYVAQIPRTANGKFRFIVSTIPMVGEFLPT